MKQRHRGLVLGLLLVGIWSCRESLFEGATDTLSADIVPGDTTMLTGTTALFIAIAQYRIGPGVPLQVGWSVSDTTKLGLQVAQDLSATVAARDTGTAQLVALVNRDFGDTVEITVVAPGLVRWRASLSGTVSRHPAVGTDSLVRVVHNAEAPQLAAFTPVGDRESSSASCFSSLSPSLGTAGEAFAAGSGCTVRHEVDGVVDWRVSVGGADHGPALAADGGVIVLQADTVVRLSASGTEVWRDTLGAPTAGAPVIAATGDIFVAFSNRAGADSLARLSSAGMRLWAVPVPGLSPQPDPALTATRVVLSRPGGVFAVDTAGTLLWDRAFADDNAGTSPTVAASAPVLDFTGGVVVQTTDALYRYDGNGALVWVADSLGHAPGTAAPGSPVLRLDGSLVVPCTAAVGGNDEVCAVRMSDGALRWRSAIGGGTVLGVAVGRAGQVYATVTQPGGSSEVVALWSRIGVEALGWPAAGGAMDRARRRR